MKKILILVTALLLPITSHAMNDEYPSWCEGLDPKWIESIPTEAVRVKRDYERNFVSNGWEYFIGPSFYFAISMIESFCKSDAVSTSNAKGCMQMKDGALADTGMEGDLFDVSFNIDASAKYFDVLGKQFEYHMGRAPIIDELALAYIMGAKGAAEYIKSGKSVFDHFYVRKLNCVWEQTSF